MGIIRGALSGLAGFAGRGEVEKKKLARGAGAGTVSFWRLHITGEAMRKKRNRAIGRGCGWGRAGVKAVRAGCRRRLRARTSIGGKSCTCAGFGDRARWRALVVVKSRNCPRPAPSRALQMGDAHPRAVTERCSFSSSAPFAMRRSFRSGVTRGFVGTPVGSASIGAATLAARGPFLRARRL
jgi:hypothetical protein